ncbi:MAG: hypothetical protein KDK90_21300, partial [Leptospiraceae bacterium]|nr:hypothetical protein [Leptospiraceae bacterium]
MKRKLTILLLLPIIALLFSCNLKKEKGFLPLLLLYNHLMNTPYSIGGEVTGLQGSGLVLVDNENDYLYIEKDGEFTFDGKIIRGGTYSVAVKEQPHSPTQVCEVSGGDGTVGGGNVTTVVVNCANDTFTVGGTVSNLGGAGLTLQLNSGDPTPISANGTFAFNPPLESGTDYLVKIVSQPTGPAQTCSLLNESGTVKDSNISSLIVTCTINTYTIAGTINGLNGDNLMLTNGTNTIGPFSAGTGAFTFPAVNSGTPYTIAITTQPYGTPSNTWQTCTITNGTGTVAGANITNVIINCTTNQYTVGGTLVNYTGSNLQLSDGTNLVNVASGATNFTFPLRNSGLPYTVTVTQNPNGPPNGIWETCTVTGGGNGAGGGNIAGANLTNVVVTCSPQAFTVGGSITGLTGSNMILTDGTNVIGPIAAGATTFTFPARNSGLAYNVSVVSQPNGSPANIWQTCTVTNPAGTIGGANITSVALSCTNNTYTVGGTINNYTGTGMQLSDGTNTINIPAGGTTFTFPVLNSGTAYTVSVAGQPVSPWQTCSVTNATGTLAGANVSNVIVNCTTNTYTVSGTISGLTGSNLMMTDGTSTIGPIASGSTTFTFPAISSGSAYGVVVTTQPNGTPNNIWQTCTVSGGGNGTGGGTMLGANVTNVSISCVTNQYTVGSAAGGLTGYSGSNLQLSDGTNTITLPAGSTSFTFPARNSGLAYTVTVASQPTTPWQTCSVTNGTGNIPGANVTNVSVNCVTNQYTVGGTITGYSGSNLTLTDGTNTLGPLLTSAGTFTFPAVNSGTAYNVSVTTQPSGAPANVWQTCTVASNTGTVTNANVTNVTINCTTNTYTLSANVAGYAGTTPLVLQNNGADNLSISVNGLSNFATVVASGAGYNVTTFTNPTNKWQTCTPVSPTGTITNANKTINVNCVTNQYSVAGTISGYTTGTNMTITDGTNSLTLPAGTTSFNFPVMNSGTAYTVAVTTQPISPWQTCSVANAGGTLTSANVTNVAITCTPNLYTVGSTAGGLTGYTGSGLQITDGTSILNVASGATSFTFPAIASGSAYTVSVLSQPTTPWQTCTVSNASGTVSNANITNVSINCVNKTYSVSGTIVGLVGDNMMLTDGTNTLGPIAATATTFTFPVIQSGSAYGVVVTTQPYGAPAGVWQTCSVTGGGNGTGGGTMAGANVTNVLITCSKNQFTVGGSITNLTGSNFIISDGTNTLGPFNPGDSAFTFPARNSGSAYNVTISSQPNGAAANVWQTCAVASPSGTIAGANITSVAITCTTNQFTVGTTATGITGYAGTGLQLTDGTNSVVVPGGATSVTFPARNSGSAYTISVLAQPTSPNQTCAVTNATGSIANANITNVAISCTTAQYTVGSSATGLTGYAGSGLQLSDGTNTINVPAGAVNFTFPARNSGLNYNVTVVTQPSSPSQTCTVTNGSGTIVNANITNVAVNCVTNQYTISGTISNLTGSNLILNDGSNAVGPLAAGTTNFTFPAINSGTAYTVVVSSQPNGAPANIWQSCSVAGGTNGTGGGTITTANVTNITVTCTQNTYTVGGTITGLTGDNLYLTDGVNSLGPLMSGTANYAFPARASGSAYSVSVTTQPNGVPSNQWQTCSVSNAAGTISSSNITNVNISCTTNTYTVGTSAGGLSGYTGSGLQVSDGTTTLPIASGATSITFPARNSGLTYNVTIVTQPTSPTQTCSVSNGSGTIANANVSNVVVSCTTNTYTIGGTVAGLSGSNMMLTNGTNTIGPITANGAYSFPGVASGTAYTVVVTTQPYGAPAGIWQTCTVSNASGTVVGANITNADINCTTNQ